MLELMFLSAINGTADRGVNYEVIIIDFSSSRIEGLVCAVGLALRSPWPSSTCFSFDSAFCRLDVADASSLDSDLDLDAYLLCISAACLRFLSWYSFSSYASSAAPLYLAKPNASSVCLCIILMNLL